MISVIVCLALLLSVWCFGVKISTQEEMVFGKIGKWASKKADEGNKIVEAIFLCEWCMPSFHGVFIVLPLCYFIGLFELSVKFFACVPFIIILSSLLSGILWNVAMILIKLYEYIQKAEELKHYDIKDRKHNFYQKINSHESKN